METAGEIEGWPPSNYPIFLALVMLAATAVTLAMGDEKRAEELAISLDLKESSFNTIKYKL